MSKQDRDHNKPEQGGDQPAAPVVSLARARDKVQLLRQDRAESELAKRFHDAMGWKGKPAGKAKPSKKKPKRKR